MRRDGARCMSVSTVVVDSCGVCGVFTTQTMRSRRMWRRRYGMGPSSQDWALTQRKTSNCVIIIFTNTSPWLDASAKCTQWHQLHTLAMSSSKSNTSVASSFCCVTAAAASTTNALLLGFIFFRRRRSQGAYWKIYFVRKKNMRKTLLLLFLRSSAARELHVTFLPYHMPHTQKFIIVNLWMPFVMREKYWTSRLCRKRLNDSEPNHAFSVSGPLQAMASNLFSIQRMTKSRLRKINMPN